MPESARPLGALLDEARDAILSANRALNGAIRCGGDGVRVAKAATIRNVMEDVRARLDAAMQAIAAARVAPEGPPPDGPWRLSFYRDATSAKYGVCKEGRYIGIGSSEAEALAVRDALNRVAAPPDGATP